MLKLVKTLQSDFVAQVKFDPWHTFTVRVNFLWGALSL